MSRRVLLTGFEPFADHAVNPSWEALRGLGGFDALGADELERQIALLPVDYEGVAARLPELIAAGPWDLAIHLGVMGERGGLRLETRARRGPYTKPDNRGLLPPQSLAPGVIEERASSADIPALLDFLEGEGVPARPSDDAGLYLCEFTYYLSLSLEAATRILFLHVPRFGEPFEPAELTDIVRRLSAAAVDA